MRESNKKRISVIIPCYCEAGNLEHLHTTLCEVINTMNGFNWRIVFVDDGSNDNSREVLARITESDPRVTALLLSRNFGKESALMAGVEASHHDVMGSFVWMPIYNTRQLSCRSLWKNGRTVGRS